MPPRKTTPRKVQLNYVAPSEKHVNFHNAYPCPVRLLPGSVSSGKSVACVYEIIRHLLFNPQYMGKKALIVSPTHTHNVQNILPIIRNILTNENKKGRNIGLVENQDYSIKLSPLEVQFFNNPHGEGSKIEFASWEQGASLRGKNVSIAFADELTLASSDEWNEIQNRTGREGVPGFVVAATNPDNKSHWLYSRYFERFDQEEAIASDKDRFPTQFAQRHGYYVDYLNIYDNPFVKHRWKEFEEQYAYSSLARELKLMGRFVSMEGVIYSQFNRDVHTIDRKAINIPEDAEVWAGLDFGGGGGGGDHTACLWIAKIDNSYVIFREHFENTLTLSQRAEALKRNIARIPPPRMFISDTYTETFLTYREHGLNIKKAHKGPGSIDQGIALVSQLLFDNRLLVTRDCVNVIREFETYQYGRNNKPQDKNNHCMDALRMVIIELEGKPTPGIFTPAVLNPIEALHKMDDDVSQARKQHNELVADQQANNRVIIGIGKDGKPQYATW